MRGVALSPLDRADQLLARRTLTDRDLTDEVRAELLAKKARQKFVYDKIDLTRQELLDGYAQQVAATGAKAPVPSKPDDATLEAIKKELLRQRGALQLKLLMDGLRRRWKVELQE